MNPVWVWLPLSLLLKLAHDDLRYRRLANKWVVGYALSFIPVAWLAGLGTAQWGAHLLVAGLAFVVLLGLFMLGVMGGGDVKLGTAVLLWAGPGYALPVLLLVAWIGGGLALLGVVVDRIPVGRAGTGWLGGLYRVFSARRGVPYGVALAGGGLWVLWRYFVGAA